MRYVCLNCGHKFELEAEQKVRCPSCMRVTGIEKVGAEAPSKKADSGRPWLLPMVGLGLLALMFGAYGYWRSRAPREVGDTVPATPLSHEELVAHLRRLRVDARSVIELLEPDDALEDLAEEIGGDGALERARAVQGFLRERASHQAFVRWSLGVPRETPLATAASALPWVREDGARHKLYPLEVAAVMTALLRSEDVDARIVEVWKFEGDDAPADPSGHFGYFVVGVYPEGIHEPTLFDPWGGHEVMPSGEQIRVLNDVEAVGAALNLRAIHMLVRENDPARAITLSGDAIRLDGRSPSARSVRGAILLASGGTQEGIEEFRAAEQLRSDAPRHQQLAGVAMAQSDLEGARREIARALELAPDYAAAHAALAAVHLTEGETEIAHEELETATRLDAELHTLPGLWAGYYATTGDTARAMEEARRAVERNPWDIQGRLMAARIYRQAGRYEEMRAEAREVVARSPESQRGDIERLVRSVLGSTALDNPLEEEASDEEELHEEEGESTLRLEEGQGATPSGRQGPSLLEGEEEPTLQLGEPSNFRLGGDGDRLRLDLSQ